MIIAVQTSAQTDDDEIRRVADKYNLTAQENTVAINDSIFHYYSATDNAIAEKAIVDFLKINGISAAYIKPGGEPPAT
jgi:hypothetical protein